MNTFLSEAVNEVYLMWKVCLLIGVADACQRDELRKMRVDDNADKNSLLVITITSSKNGKKRTFTLTDDIVENINPLELYRKYAALRPSHCNHNTYFVNYKLGKCSIQVVGVHTFGKIPSSIAKYLNLVNPKEYTGHCYRRTSATLLADSGADILTFKMHGGWKSATVAEGYVEDSLNNTITISKDILTGASSSSLHSSNNTIQNDSTQNTETISLSASTSKSGITLNNCSNCTINIKNE